METSRYTNEETRRNRLRRGLVVAIGNLLEINPPVKLPPKREKRQRQELGEPVVGAAWALRNDRRLIRDDIRTAAKGLKQFYNDSL